MPSRVTARFHRRRSVVYVIAERLERLDMTLPAMNSMSRDFH